MQVAFSINGVPIRLTDERWAHIVESHDDLAGCRDQILQTIEMPDSIYEGYEGALVAVKAGKPGKNLCVIYREMEKDGFVITAYFSSKRSRGRKIWPAS